MKILVIQQKMIGDVLTTSILFEVLKESYPDAELHYLINSHTASVVDHNPFIDKNILLAPEIEKSKLKLLRFLTSLREENYDIVIDVYSKLSSNLMTYFTKADIRISKYKWYSSFIYNQTFKEKKSTTSNVALAIVNRLQLLTTLCEVVPDIVLPKIYLQKEEITKAKKMLVNKGIDLKKPLFMISVLGSAANKTYPPQYMAQIIDLIVEETEAQILCNYLPEQRTEAKNLIALCKKETRQHINFDIFGNSLREFLSITKHCDALIGNEGGAINMAKALGLSTFTIFSPWILKQAWNLLEDKETHVAIHLKDFKPALFEGIPLKNLKKQATDLYDSFTPDLVISSLKKYLQKF